MRSSRVAGGISIASLALVVAYGYLLGRWRRCRRALNVDDQAMDRLIAAVEVREPALARQDNNLQSSFHGNCFETTIGSHPSLLP